MAWSLTIDRSSLSLADLVISDADTSVYSMDKRFAVGDNDPGNIYASSPWSAPVLIGQQPSVRTMAFSFHVYGADWPTLVSNMTTLVNAFSQRDYVLTYAISSTTVGQWRCFPAGYGPGDGEAWDDDELANEIAAVRFTVPRYHTIGGPF